MTLDSFPVQAASSEQALERPRQSTRTPHQASRGRAVSTLRWTENWGPNGTACATLKGYRKGKSSRSDPLPSNTGRARSAHPLTNVTRWARRAASRLYHATSQAA